MLNLKNVALSYLVLLSSIINTHDFNIIPVSEALKKYPEIEYIKCYDIQPFEYKEFFISRFPELQPNKGLLAENFILKIPNGQICYFYGWLKIDNNIISESFLPYYSVEKHIRLVNQKKMRDQNSFKNVKKIKGKVAVLTTALDNCYFHWIYNTLSRLALLEQQKIEYDWLFVACDSPYMKEMLSLWGIDLKKIIEPFKENAYIQADELIFPSHLGVREPEPQKYVSDWIPLELFCEKWDLDFKEMKPIGSNIKKIDSMIPHDISLDNIHLRWTALCSMYYHPQILNYMQYKLLSCLKETSSLNKRVFISRKDAAIRNLLNEDEIFAIFEKNGFTRYNLANLSVLEQIELFHNADIIVAAHGAALSNLLFCKPNTHVIEIFQERSDCCFYYLSQDLKLNYHYIKTTEFKNIEGQISTIIDQKIIQTFMDNHQYIFEQ